VLGKRKYNIPGDRLPFRKQFVRTAKNGKQSSWVNWGRRPSEVPGDRGVQPGESLGKFENKMYERAKSGAIESNIEK